MNANQASHLTDDQISAVLDGEGDDWMSRHIEQCNFCALRLKQARTVEVFLKNKLHRWNCPTAQQIGDYHAGLLDQAEMDEIAQHLRQCAHCRQELDELRIYLSADTEPEARPHQPHPRRPRRQLLGELVARLLPRSQAPAYAMRGADTDFLVAEADGASIFLDARPSPEGVVISGQVVAGDETSWDGALVELRQAGTLQGTTLVDEFGQFHCKLPDAAPITLRITSVRGISLVLEGVELNR
jgi:hypothetical protein